MVSSVTKDDVTRRCRWCGRGLPPPGRTGRPRQFCTQACRQKDYISRIRAEAAGLSDAELVITRTELDDLRDKLYVLECAIDDVRQDLADGDDPKAALLWILQAAEPLLGAPLGESTT